MTEERGSEPSHWVIADDDDTPFLTGITAKALDQRITESFVSGKAFAVADFARKIESMIVERLAAAIRPSDGRLRVVADYEKVLAEVMEELAKARPTTQGR